MILLMTLCLLSTQLLHSREPIPTSKAFHSSYDTQSETADCNAPKAFIELNINNVRARLLNGGDGWWDPIKGRPGYEIPKIPNGSSQQSIHSIFCGALWIGGIDETGQLKLAAQTYRQSGHDFWPGPLDENGQTEFETCKQFDRFWEVLGTDIYLFQQRFEVAGGSLNPSEIPNNILQWPGKDNPYFTEFDLPQNRNFAPFFDNDDDGQYNPTKGDFPVIDIGCGGIYADQMIWWVINDRGNTHEHTNSPAMGLEIGNLAYAYATSDELNNMTFYQYTLENKSNLDLDSIYFGQFIDPDLGLYTDDFVGCIPHENIGVCYNGDAIDEGYYRNSPPMIGIDFIKTPKKMIGYDVDGNTIYQDIGLTSFLPYSGNFDQTGNPENALHFYYFMSGRWKDGSYRTYGGWGAGGTVPYPFMYPSDPTDNSPEAWSECSENNTPFDRRFIQATGPFNLGVGAVEEVLISIVWVQDGLDYPCPSFQPLIQASRKAQALFENCFQLQDGPDAPLMFIRELDQELIISLWNDTLVSNNAFEQYAAPDWVLASQGFPDSMYTFQGYKLFQLESPDVTPDQYADSDKARLVAQVDVKDGTSKLINWTKDYSLGVLVPELKVEGSNNGIVNSFKITDDQFATGSKRLINNSKYYYSAVAYSFNAHEPYDDSASTPTAQLIPYLEGRHNIKVYTAIPHIATPQREGIELNSQFGDGPPITRILGSGNGGQVLEFSEESTNEILANGFLQEVIYKGGYGPLNIKVFDPFNVPDADFRLTLENISPSGNIVSPQSTWTLENLTTGQVFFSEQDISRGYTQAIGGFGNQSLGFSIAFQQPPLPNNTESAFLTASLEFDDAQQNWLSLVADDEVTSPFNWIRSGISESSTNSVINDNREGLIGPFYDPNELYENILDGKIAPYSLTNSKFTTTATFKPLAPACSDCYGVELSPTLNLQNLHSIDLVFTQNKDLWTQCVVVEMSKDPVISQGKAKKNSLRHHPSWNHHNDNYTSPISSNTLSAGNNYFVNGTSAAGISYLNASGITVIKPANSFFQANDINETTAFISINGALLYHATDIGRSWFPGYAINLETGERLNIVFGENSFFSSEQGDDMKWNPSATLLSPQISTSRLRIGGEHYIYVMETLYDAGQTYQNLLVQAVIQDDLTKKQAVYEDAMWVTLPYLTPGFEIKPVNEGLIPFEAKIKVRVARPYMQASVTNPKLQYEFSFRDLAAKHQQTEVAKKAVSLVKIVPNPYYAFSLYETMASDKRVKITNLPARANITVFSLDGSIVRTIKVDNSSSNIDTAAGNEAGSEQINTVEWDMKNLIGKPIDSGIYLIHVAAPDLGEEVTLKFFCIARSKELQLD